MTPLRERRIDLGMTLTDLSAESEVSRSTISDLENELSLPRRDTAYALADILESNIEDLFPNGLAMEGVEQ